MSFVDLFCFIDLVNFISEKNIKEEVWQQAEIHIKYDGYMHKEKEAVKKLSSLENIKIPEGFKYDNLHSISSEGKEKLKEICPNSVGQASRISGVSASDINILLIYIGR